jgi:hypothetical protein
MLYLVGVEITLHFLRERQLCKVFPKDLKVTKILNHH